MSSEAPQITIVGLGSMGAALAKAQLDAGAQVTTWNRNANRPSVQTLMAAGAKFEPEIGAAISASSVVVFCVLDYLTLNGILEPLFSSPAMPLRGKIFLNFTNGTPREAREMSEQMQKQDVEAYMDGGIMAGPDKIGTPTSFVLVSGANEPAFTRVKEIVEVFGRTTYYGSDPGAACLYDLAILAGLYGMVAGVLTSISMMRRARPHEEQGEPSLEMLVTNMLNPFLQSFLASNAGVAKAIDTNDSAAHGHSVEMRNAVMKNIKRTCEEEGVDSGALVYFFGLVEEVVKDGNGDKGISILASKLLKSKPLP